MFSNVNGDLSSERRRAGAEWCAALHREHPSTGLSGVLTCATGAR